MASAAVIPVDWLPAYLLALPRPALAILTERLIERMDELDGDPDLEPNGDELDGTGGEDDFAAALCNTGEYSMPGCPISDPGEDVDEDRCEAGDDGCGPVPIWQTGRIAWGSELDDDGL